MSWINFDDVKPYLTYDSNTNFSVEEQEFINTLCSAVCDFIEKYCCRKIERTQITEYLDGCQTKILTLSYLPIDSLELYYDLAREFPENTKLTENEDYFLNADLGVIYLLFEPALQKRIFKAIYYSGWSVDAIPSDLKNCACELVVYKYDKIRKKEMDMATKAGQGASITFASSREEIPSHIRATLDNYRLII